MKITQEQIEILDKVFEAEVNGDDPCITKREKKRIMKEMRETGLIPSSLWYELSEAIGCYAKYILTDEERQKIAPIQDGAIMSIVKKPPHE